MKITSKEISSYLIWIAVNLLLLLSLGTIKFSNGEFYPFEGFDEIKDYDISEFLVYTIIPLLIIIAIKLRKN